jgi:hypothetical protein
VIFFTDGQDGAR